MAKKTKESSKFIKEHPSLVGQSINIEFDNGDIDIDLRGLFKTQLDKAKVREAIEKSINKWDHKFSLTAEEIIEDLKKELELK